MWLWRNNRDGRVDGTGVGREAGEGGRSGMYHIGNKSDWVAETSSLLHKKKCLREDSFAATEAVQRREKKNTNNSAERRHRIVPH